MAPQKVKAASLTWPSSLLELMSDQVVGLGTFMEPCQLDNLFSKFWSPARLSARMAVVVARGWCHGGVET
jgi:hypothetical protein